jgi:hypothetical protein
LVAEAVVLKSEDIKSERERDKKKRIKKEVYNNSFSTNKNNFQ